MDVKDMIFLKIEADDTGELEQEKGKMMRERMKRRIWRSVVSMLLVCGLCLGMPDVAAFAEDTAPTSGTCGENLTWKLDADGTLTISGTGWMFDYSSNGAYGGVDDASPWYDSRKTMQTSPTSTPPKEPHR